MFPLLRFSDQGLSCPGAWTVSPGRPDINQVIQRICSSCNPLRIPLSSILGRPAVQVSNLSILSSIMKSFYFYLLQFGWSSSEGKCRLYYWGFLIPLKSWSIFYPITWANIPTRYNDLVLVGTISYAHRDGNHRIQIPHLEWHRGFGRFHWSTIHLYITIQFLMGSIIIQDVKYSVFDGLSPASLLDWSGVILNQLLWNNIEHCLLFIETQRTLFGWPNQSRAEQEHQTLCGLQRGYFVIRTETKSLIGTHVLSSQRSGPAGSTDSQQTYDLRCGSGL